MTDAIQSTATEDLAYIRRIMEDTRRAVTMRGEYFILWGFAVLFGMIGTYVFSQIGPPNWVWAALWGGLMLIAWACTGLLVRRQSQQTQASTPVGRILGKMWSAFGFAIMLVCFVGAPLGVIPFNAIGPTISILVGVGVYVSGMLMDTRWVRNLAFGWWACAIAEFIWHSDVQALIGAVAITLLYIIPGFIMNTQARKLSAAKQA